MGALTGSIRANQCHMLTRLNAKGQVGQDTLRGMGILKADRFKDDTRLHRPRDTSQQRRGYLSWVWIESEGFA